MKVTFPTSIGENGGCMRTNAIYLHNKGTISTSNLREPKFLCISFTFFLGKTVGEHPTACVYKT